MAKDEIKISFVDLKNNILKLKAISDSLSVIESSQDCFSESAGLSKDALSKQLSTTVSAGLLLKQAIDDLVVDLDMAASTFRDMDESLSKQFRYCGMVGNSESRV